MSKKVYIFLADGFEDIEGLTVVDLLRRAGIDIKTVSIKETKCQRILCSLSAIERYSVYRSFEVDCYNII